MSQGSSYAGATALAEDPTTLFFNPAGIGFLEGVQLSASAALLLPRTHTSNASATTGVLLGGSPITGDSSGNASSAAVIPSLYAAAALSPSIHVGFAVFSPAGIDTQYSPNFIGRYYARTTLVRTIDAAPTLAWRVGPALAVSASLTVESKQAYLSDNVDFGAIGAVSGLAGVGLRPELDDGTGSFKGSDVGLGYQIGASYRPLHGTRIGLSYRSAIFHDLQGHQMYGAIPAVLAAGFVDGSAALKLPTPASVSLGLTQSLGAWSILADVRWTQWSRIQALDIQPIDGATIVSPQRLRDRMMLALGLAYRLNPALTLRSGIAFDPTPTRDGARTPSAPDSDRTSLSAGATWLVSPRFALSVAYSHVFFGTADIDLTDAGPGTPNFLRGDLQAREHTPTDVVALQATTHF